MDIDDIDGPGSLGQCSLQGAQQLDYHWCFEGIEHVNEQRFGGPGELGCIALEDLQLTTRTRCLKPDGEIATGLFYQAGVHLNADHPCEGIERSDHNDTTHSGAEIEERVFLKRRFRDTEGGAPGIDRCANDGGRGGAVENTVEIVSMAGPEPVAGNKGLRLDAVLEVKWVGLQPGRAYSAISAEGKPAERPSRRAPAKSGVSGRSDDLAHDGQISGRNTCSPRMMDLPVCCKFSLSEAQSSLGGELRAPRPPVLLWLSRIRLNAERSDKFSGVPH